MELRRHFVATHRNLSKPGLPALILLFIISIVNPRMVLGAPEQEKAPGAPVLESEGALTGIAVALPSPESGKRGAPVRRIAIAEIVDLALEENLDLALARAEEQVALADSRISAWRLLPGFEGGGGVGRTDGRVQGSFGDLREVDFNTVNPQFAIAYRVNVVSRIYDALAARRDLDAAVYDALSTEQRLLFRVTDLFYQLALGRIGEHIARQRVIDGEQFVTITSARERAGVGLGADVVRAEASLAESRSELVQARNLWETVSTDLAVVLRLDPATLLDPAGDRIRPLDLLPDMAALNVEERARRRPEVKALEEREAAASRRARSAWWDVASPEVNGIYRETFIGEEFDNLKEGRKYGVFLGWTLSLEKLGRVSKRRREKKVAELRVQRAAERAAGEAHIALKEVEASRERLPLANEGLDAAERNHRISLARFRGGTAIALEVLDAQDVLAKARLDLARSIVDYNLAQVRLLATSGIIKQDLLTPDHEDTTESP